MNIDKYSTDQKVGFNEANHAYFIVNEPSKKFTSCTTLIKKYVTPFDKLGTAKKYALKNGLNVQDVLNEWTRKGEIAAIKGTYIHKCLEDFFIEGKIIETKGEYPEEESAKQFYRDYIESGKWEIVRSEELVYNTDCMISGQIDAVVKDLEKNVYYLIDYKTSKKIDTKGFRDRRLKIPFEHMPDCEWGTYSLQLAVYQDLYKDIIIADKYIVHIKPDGYDVIKAFPVKVNITKNEELTLKKTITVKRIPK